MGGSPDTVSAARRRVCVAFIIVALGLTAARSVHIPSLTWFSAGLGFCACACWLPPRLCRLFLAAALFLASGGWMQARVFERPADSLAYLADDESLITVEGVLLSTPREVQSRSTFPFLDQPRSRFDLRVDTLITPDGPRRARGDLWVSVRTRPHPTDLLAGDRLRLSGTFGHIDPPLNPGEEDLRLYAAQSGVAGSLTLSSPDLITRLPTRDPIFSRWLRFRAALEDRARAIVERAGGEENSPGRALLLGLILGDYDPQQRAVREAFARQGLAHVLSISGFHLSVMALLALAIFRLTGDRGWVEPLTVAALVLLYLLVVPPSSPILRSAAMVLAVLLAEAAGRRYDRLTLLGWIGIALLAWRPLDLWNVGYQLSLGLTAALFWLAPLCHAKLWGVPIEGLVRREVTPAAWLLDHLKQSVSAAVLCWTLSLPLIIHRFGLISPLAILATIFITPFIVVLLWAGYIALVAGVFFPPAADAASLVLSQLSAWTVACVRLMDDVPFSAIDTPVVSPLWAFTATGIVIYWIRAGHWRDVRAWIASAIIAAWFVYGCVFSSGLSRDVTLRIDTLAVGDGTCHLIRSGDEALLWDCAPMRTGGVMPPLQAAVRALGAWRAPTVVITHPDIDHFGGLVEVLRPLGVRRVLVSPRFIQQARIDPRGSAASLLLELRLRNIEVSQLCAGDRLALGSATLTFLAPPADAPWPQDNDHSLVAAISIDAGPEVLLTGDIQDHAINAITAAHPDLTARVLELPHHGSARPKAMTFAQNINPAIVLQSTGPRRAGDPRWDALRPGRAWYTTCTDGAAWVEFLANGEVRHGGVRSGHTASPRL